MAEAEASEILASDLYTVPRAIDASGNQVRPRVGMPRDGYTCPVCTSAVILCTSSAGNLFFRHPKTDEDSCRAEPRVQLAAREILTTLIDHARAKRLRLIVQVACTSCGKGNQIPFPLGDVTEASDDLWLEEEIGGQLKGDVTCINGGHPVAAIVLQSESARSPEERQLLSEPWIEVSAATIKGSNLLCRAVYEQREEATIKAESSSELVVCVKCREKEERRHRKEEEVRRQSIREQAKLDKLAHRLAQQLGQMPLWWIQMPDKCGMCRHPMAVRVSSTFFDVVSPLVTDGHGHPWHVGLLRGNDVVLGVLIVQAATFDGATALGRSVPYVVVPMLDQPFIRLRYGDVLVTKHVHFDRAPKMICLHCDHQREIQEEGKRQAEAQRARDDALRVAEAASRRQWEERIAREKAKELAAKQRAEAERRQLEIDTARFREEQELLERQLAVDQEERRIVRERHTKSPRGQLERAIEEVTSRIMGHDRPTFLRVYREQRRLIADLRRADPTAGDLALEAQVRLDRMSNNEWGSVQRREKVAMEVAEANKVRASMESAWKTLIEQLTRWRDDKEWTIPEEMAIAACERFFQVNQLFLPPAEWGRLIAGRKRLAPAPIVRAEVLPPR